MQEKSKQHYSFLDIVSLCEERQRNALLPEAGEVCRQISSTDRRSAYDAQTDTYLHWDANDGDGYGNCGVITDERGEAQIALDLTGSGYISSIWFARLDEGNADLIIDGVRYENGGDRAKDLFTASGNFKGLDGLIYQTPGPAWLFKLPISFQKSCRILLRKNWGIYYNISYVLFPDGVTVEPFPQQFSAEQKAALQALSDRFLKQHAYLPSIEAFTDITVPAGKTVTALQATGCGALDGLCMRVNGFETMDAAQKETIAEGITVAMYWDGEEKPAVWAPLGALFGSPLADPFSTFSLGLTQDGVFYIRFLLPYANGAKVVLCNETEQDASFGIAMQQAALQMPIEYYGRFHAKWSRNCHPVLRPDRFPDHTLLKTCGRGRFMGITFHAYEKEEFGWWGEGDEKFFVDGEKFPSWYGTGSEDYFGFSHGRAIMFERPYHAQLRQDGGFYGAGHKIDLRLHQTDSIPFQNEIEVCIEKYLEDEKVSYDTVAYWYLSPDGIDDYEPVALRERVKVWREYVCRPVEQILLRQQTATLRENEELRIIAKVIPAEYTDNRALVWHCSDPAVAAVDARGQVLALKAGNATITASIGCVKAACHVTVLPQAGSPSPSLSKQQQEWLQEHTVAHYDFANANEPCKDRSGNGMDLSFYTLVDGQYRESPELCKTVPALQGKRALALDGVTFLLQKQVNAATPIDALQSFTVTYREHMPSRCADAIRENGRNYKTVLDKGGATCASGWFLGSDTDTQVACNEFFCARSSNGELLFNCVNAPHFRALSWQQITYTVDATNGRIAVYLNGHPIREATVEQLALANDHPLTVGAAVSKTTNGWEIVGNSGFVGELTDIRILNTALTPEQVLLLTAALGN